MREIRKKKLSKSLILTLSQSCIMNPKYGWYQRVSRGRFHKPMLAEYTAYLVARQLDF